MVNGEYEFQCQHGATECLGNMVHNCAVKYVKEPLPYLTCMMENNWEPLAIGKKVSPPMNNSQHYVLYMGVQCQLP